MKLRSLIYSDLEDILLWRNHPDVRKNMYNTEEISLEEHKQWFTSIEKDSNKKYLIYENNEGHALGVIAFTMINQKFHNACWAFYASPSAPKGIGVKMEFLALEYAFNELELYKLYCEVISFNKAVISLHQKFGFTIEGIFKEQVYLHDDFHDVYRLGLFKHEWKDIRDTFISKILRNRKN